LRLLWVQNSFWPDLQGGAETRSYFTVRALSRLGHQVDVLCRATVPVGEEHRRLEAARIYRVPAPEIPVRFWRIRPWLRMRQWRGMCRAFLRDREYDGAITVQAEAAYYLRRLRPRLRLVLATCGTFLGAKAYDFVDPDSPFLARLTGKISFRQYYFYERRAYRMADQVVAESRNVREQLVCWYRVPSRKAPVIRSGVDTDLFRPRGMEDRLRIRRRENWPEQAFLVIGVGRLDRIKNFEYLLRSVASAAKRMDVHGVLVGRGEQREYLGRRAAELNIADRIHFCGFRSDVPELLPAADAFLLPSVYEAYGAAWPEALACGLPCLGLRREFGRINAAGEEHIDHGRNGFVVDPDDPGDCASRLLEVGMDRGLHQRMSEAARASALANYSWERTAKGYEGLFS
jgi:glycosyltransferase involved in cell wall biosynthesis